MEDTKKRLFPQSFLWVLVLLLSIWGCPLKPSETFPPKLELKAPWAESTWYDSLKVTQPPLEQDKLFPFLQASNVKVYSFNFGKKVEEAQFRLIRGDRLTEELPQPDAGNYMEGPEANELLACLSPPHKALPNNVDVVCFYYPRHGFIFYDDHHHPIGALEVCFECQEYRMYPNAWLTMYPEGFKRLEGMLQKMGIQTREGASPSSI